jgi:steroid 5-alpha reductase family enzyme
MMPTVMVFAGCLSLYPALVINPTGYSYVFDTLGLVIAVGATAIELLADEQMKRFCRSNKEKGKVMDEGLWSLSRHPNYFGEVSFWWGLYFFALAASLSYWWCFAGPLAITILFIVVSIPLMEKRQLARRPNFEEYKERVSVFIPWFPKKNKEE